MVKRASIAAKMPYFFAMNVVEIESFSFTFPIFLGGICSVP